MFENLQNAKNKIIIFAFLFIIFFSAIINMGGGLLQLVAYGAQDVYLN